MSEELEEKIEHLTSEVNTLSVTIGQIDSYLEPLVEALNELRGASQYVRNMTPHGIDYLSESIQELATAIEEKK